MRSVFQDELDSVSESLVNLTTTVSTAMSQATDAILNADLKVAEEVIANDQKIDEFQHDIDSRIIDIIARQQPVATDLRALVSALRMSADIERMGDFAHHVAKIARMRHPQGAVPAELVATIKSMGSAAVRITEKIGVVIATRDVEMALEIEGDDDEMDALHRDLIAALVDKPWNHGIEVAINLTLLGRYYERYSDHAVSVSRRVYYLVKGEYA
ncbi:MAG: phosphate signaling complex protein PhoU [Actinomycetota bacterium]|nr:phosphate signaling complex protein PhoU [Actinomycetota bacterium]